MSNSDEVIPNPDAFAAAREVTFEHWKAIRMGVSQIGTCQKCRRTRGGLWNGWCVDCSMFRCPVCHGSGLNYPGHAVVKCQNCGGSGSRRDQQPRPDPAQVIDAVLAAARSADPMLPFAPPSLDPMLPDRQANIRAMVAELRGKIADIHAAAEIRAKEFVDMLVDIQRRCTHPEYSLAGLNGRTELSCHDCGGQA